MAEKIGDFIKRFDIDPVMATKFFVNLRDNRQVYIDNSTIEWMGYSGPLKKQRQQLSELLSRNFDEGKDYHIYDNASYAQWLSTLESHNYPPVPTGRGTYHTKHILLKADTFRELMMMLQTSRAPRIRKFYIQLERVIKAYIKYQYGQKHKTAVKNMIKGMDGRMHAVNELERKLATRQRIGCVYFIQEEKGLTKIGWCWNLPRRLAELQVANPRPLQVIKTITTSHPVELESRLHDQYADKHVRGEWFDL